MEKVTRHLGLRWRNPTLPIVTERAPGAARPIGPYERRVAEVHEWDPRTVEVAHRVAELVRAQRPDLTVEHIGSTAVAGLPGKGIVDLSIETDPADIPKVVELLYDLGFQPQPGPDPWPPTRPMPVGSYDLDGERFRIHLHVQPRGGDFPRDIAFRDALRSDPELTRQYAELKRGITRDGPVDGFRYTHSKTTWILGVYRRLGFVPPAITPPSTIGILGAGPDARLLALAARRLGYRVAALGTDPLAPAAAVVDRYEVGSATDTDAARRLAAGCAVVTSAFDDGSPTALVAAIDDGRLPVRPGPYPLKLTQDRDAERRFLEANGVAVPAAHAGHGAETELAIVVARAADGTCSTFAPGRLTRSGTETSVAVPAGVPDAVEARACELGELIATGMGLVGILTVELLMEPDGSLSVGALFPKVHADGAWTIEGAATSEFEQHLRAICGLPLGDVGLRVPAAATVRLVSRGPAREARPLGVDAALRVPDAHVHLYDVRTVAAGRIMGHVTALGATADEALERAHEAASRISWR
jgi:5-(carboxyamino)imidazole ribonucleotide synthase